VVALPYFMQRTLNVVAALIHEQQATSHDGQRYKRNDYGN
jgi:hypothetical protein